MRKQLNVVAFAVSLLLALVLVAHAQLPISIQNNGPVSGGSGSASGSLQGVTSISFPNGSLINTATTKLQLAPANGTAYLTIDNGAVQINSANLQLNPGGNFLVSSLGTLSISSGFGTTPSIVANSQNGCCTFRVNVGTGGVATTGTVGISGLTASNGYNCVVQDMTTNIATRQTSDTTTSITVTAASAWTASDILVFVCNGR